MPDGCRRGEPPIEMDSFDDGVDGQDLDTIPLWFDNGGIVANANKKPGRGRLKPLLDAGDQLAFGEVGNDVG
jgi:hypothetical protein